MSLSGNKPTEIATYQILLELVQLLAALQSDPKALEKAAKNAYGLADAEQAKADEARKDIAKYQDLINQNDRQKQEISNQLADLEKQKTAFQTQVTSLSTQKADLAQKEADFSETKRNILALADETKTLNARLDKRSADLDKKEDQ